MQNWIEKIAHRAERAAEVELQGELRKYYEGVTLVFPEWPSTGVTMEQAANALSQMTRAMPSIRPEPIGDSSDGVKPCSYEELWRQE